MSRFFRSMLAAWRPAAGTPAAGTPAAGMPAAGTPAAGMPAAGMPAKALAALALTALLAACASQQAAINDARYDLGPQATQAQQMQQAAQGKLGKPLLKVLAVSAPPPLDNDGIVYRMNVDSQRTGRYANSRWTMSPARLLTERLRTALGANATVLSGADAVPAPMLKVELTDFEQVFQSATESMGVLAARATLMQGNKVLAQRDFVVSAPASSPDAAGGVHALQAASDDFAGQLNTWLGSQVFAGTP